MLFIFFYLGVLFQKIGNIGNMTCFEVPVSIDMTGIEACYQNARKMVIWNGNMVIWKGNMVIWSVYYFLYGGDNMSYDEYLQI